MPPPPTLNSPVGLKRPLNLAKSTAFPSDSLRRKTSVELYAVTTYERGRLVTDFRYHETRFQNFCTRD
jgi:hypothetical protein